MLKTQGNITMALHFLELTLNIRSVRKFLLFGETCESESDAPSALQCKDATGQVMQMHGCIAEVKFIVVQLCTVTVSDVLQKCSEWMQCSDPCFITGEHRTISWRLLMHRADGWVHCPEPGID